MEKNKIKDTNHIILMTIYTISVLSSLFLFNK